MKSALLTGVGAFSAVGFGLLIAVKPSASFLLIVVAVLGTTYLLAPAAWVPVACLSAMILYSVLVPVNATAGLFELGPLSGVSTLALFSSVLAVLVVAKVGLDVLVYGGKIMVGVAVFLLLFFIISAVSSPPDPQVWLGKLLIWASVFVLAVCVPQRLIPVVLSTCVALAFLEGAYAFYEYLSRPPVLYEAYLVKNSYQGGVVSTTVGESLARAQGTFGHPIPLSSFLVSACVLALFAVRFPAGRYLSLLRTLVLVTIVMGIVATFSRSSWIALFIAVAIGLLMPQRDSRINYRVVVVMLAAFSILMLWRIVLGDPILEYVSNVGNTVSYEQRVASLRSVPEILGGGLIPVVFGIGAGSELDVYSRVDLQSVEGLRFVDNQYITLLIQLGIVGLSTFLLVIWSALRFAWRSVSVVPRVPDSRIIWGIGVALLATLIAIFFYEGLSWPSTAVLVWLLLGLLARCEMETARRSSAVPRA